VPAGQELLVSDIKKSQSTASIRAGCPRRNAALILAAVAATNDKNSTSNIAKALSLVERREIG
jgi:hypothetical protein